jgi:hypothetical protein
MQLQCPTCGNLIPASQMNAEKDTAVCSNCSHVFVLTELLAQGHATDIDLSTPPPGAWYHKSFDGWEVGASTQSWDAVVIALITCVWAVSVGNLYGSQVVHGKFNLGSSLFGIPFLLGTFWLLAMATMKICGKVRISFASGKATLFCGAIGFGRRKQFLWTDIKSVKQEFTKHSKGSAQKVIVLVRPAESSIRFGSMLSANRMDFLCDALRAKLLCDTRSRS